MGAYLTADLPGTGGRIREQLEDFVVEEIPLYEPSGVGEHCYLLVQKSELATQEAAHRLAKALSVPVKRVGYAGLKDARAVCRQTFSVQGVSPEQAQGVEVRGLTVLSAKRHKNKLRIGHLAGNRFLIRIRDVDAGGAKRAEEILDVLAVQGVPNLFGAQRFGSKGDNWVVGRALLARDHEAAVDRLLGDPDGTENNPRLAEARERYMAGDLEGALAAFPTSYRAERRVLEALVHGADGTRALTRMPRAVLRLLISSYQSRLFNRLLEERMPGLDRLQKGDLAWLHDRGAVFEVEDPAAEQPRADAFEMSPSGPLYGRKVLLAGGEPGRRERELLADEGFELEDFHLQAARLSGARRPFRVPLGEPRVRPEGEDVLLLSFSLPRGSYATAVVREVTKDERAAPD